MTGVEFVTVDSIQDLRVFDRLDEGIVVAKIVGVPGVGIVEVGYGRIVSEIVDLSDGDHVMKRVEPFDYEPEFPLRVARPKLPQPAQPTMNLLYNERTGRP